jgi:uncharacterized Ntn-hydrolase superfamily protein
MMNRILTVSLFICFLAADVLAQDSFNSEDPFAHTFSIVAQDSSTGDVGVAVQSHWFSVGNTVSWAEAGVGAVATQSLINKSFGPRALDLLKQGYSPQQAMDSLIAGDDGRAFRQVAIVDVQGRVAVYTGEKCIARAGHIKGDQYSVQANMMLNDSVWPAMSKAYENAEGPLAERMVAAMQAAQKAGGDIRGQQSAAILVVKGESTGKEWEDRKIDLRVDDHPQAVNEISRLLKVHRAYEHMNEGDLAIEEGNVDKALQEYGQARQLFPKNIEMTYWTAVSMANAGRLEEALPLFKEVFSENENWVTLTKRITENGILSVPKDTLDRILSAHK